MKRALILSAFLLWVISVGTVSALPVGSIEDTYLHPNDKQLGQRNDDVIGNPRVFDIYGHRWNNRANSLEIYLSWSLGLDGLHLGAKLGDVFFYDPSGKELEYFVPLRNHDRYDGNGMQKGHVYRVVDTLVSNDYYPSTPTRQYGDNEIVTGIGRDTGILARVGYQSGSEYNSIILGFQDRAFDYLYGRDIRFAFTCGNDVHAQVPEPNTMILFSFGLIGIAGFGRRILKRK